MKIRRSLENETFRIATFEMQHVIKFKNVDNKFIFEKHSGYLADFMLILQEYLGFKYVLFENEAEGVKLENGTWTGRNGHVHRNEAEIGYPTGITYDRLEAVDYSNVYSVLRVNFFTAKPDELSKMLALIYPFEKSIWIAIMFTSLICAIIFYWIVNLQAKMQNRKNVRLYDIFWALFSSFTNKGHSLFEAGLCCRPFVFAWIVSIFIIVASYSGALMSFLIYSGQETVPLNFPQLIEAIKNGHYTASTLFHSGIGKLIREATEETPLLLELKKLIDQGKISDVGPKDDPYQFLLKKKHALIDYEPDGLMYMSALGADQYLTSEDDLYIQYEILAIPKGFPYKKTFNAAIRRLVEAGLFIQTLNLQINMLKNKKVVVKEEHLERPLYAEDLIGAFVLLFIGYVISVLLFILEVIMKNFSKTNDTFVK